MGTAASSTGAAAGWSLIGGGDQPVPVVAPLGEGKLLACTSTRCDTWDLATSTWTPAGTGLALSYGYVVAHLRDGSLFLYDAGAKRTTHIWSAGAEGWREAAPLPDFAANPQVQVLSDGRVLIAGNDATGGRAYVADPQVTAWSALAQPPKEAMLGQRLATRSGLFVVVESGERTRLWHLEASPERWVELRLPGWQGGPERHAVPWNAEVLLVGTRDGHRAALLVAADGRTRTPAKLPDGGRLTIGAVRASPGRDAPLALRVDATPYLWRGPTEPPLAFPPDPLGSSSLDVAIDRDHFVTAGPQRTLGLLSLDDRPQGGGPCDGLTRYLDVVSESTVFGTRRWISKDEVRQVLALVTPACRAQVQRGEAPALRARLRAWSSAPAPAPRELGRVFTCLFAEGVPPPEITDWATSSDLPLARATCLVQLASWPGGEVALAVALGSAVRYREIDPVVLAAAQGSDAPALRNRLAPTLRKAQAQRAAGFTTLRDAICAQPTAADPAELRNACAAAAGVSETTWSSDSADRDWGGAVTAAVVATAVVVGAVAGAHAWQNDSGGRGIATAAGVVGGMTVGLGLGGLVAVGGGVSKSDGGKIVGGVIGGALVGGILGGVAAYYLAEDPSARAPVTAAGLALPYLLTLALAFK